MKAAVIGSRGLTIPDLEKYLPEDVTEIVSGGAKGIDACAKKYALAHQIKLTEFLPDYKTYKKGAPLKRNLQIIDYSDTIFAFWDGKSRGTKFLIENGRKANKQVVVYVMSPVSEEK